MSWPPWATTIWWWPLWLVTCKKKGNFAVVISVRHRDFGGCPWAYLQYLSRPNCRAPLGGHDNLASQSGLAGARHDDLLATGGAARRDDDLVAAGPHRRLHRDRLGGA